MLAAIDSRTNKIVWKKEMPPNLGTSGPLTTAGGLMFRGDAGGSVQAYDAKTGDLLWEFQTGVRGARGPAMSYEVDNQQYIAVAMGTALWTFKLDGTIEPQAAPRAFAPARGAGEETSQIETATLVQSADRGVGRRYAVDEHAFNPGPRQGQGRHLRHLHEQRTDDAHRDGPGRFVDDRCAEERGVGVCEVRQARDIPLQLQGTSLGDRRVDGAVDREQREARRLAGGSVSAGRFLLCVPLFLAQLIASGHPQRRVGAELLDELGGLGPFLELERLLGAFGHAERGPPEEVLALMLAPFWTRYSMTSFKPRNAAPWSAVNFASLTAFRSAPASTRILTAVFRGHRAVAARFPW